MSDKAIVAIEHHPLEPFLPKNGRLLMLGSFPPQKKRWCMDFFYPNFTNDMWRVIGLLFFGNALHFVDQEKKLYRMTDIVAFLNSYGIGIYDTACAVRRLKDNASDKELEIVEATDIEALLMKMPQCKTIVATGQKAAETISERYGVKMPKVGEYTSFKISGFGSFPKNNLDIPCMNEDENFRLYRMPSTSRAYPLALKKKAEVYGRMFSEVFNENSLFH